MAGLWSEGGILGGLAGNNCAIAPRTEKGQQPHK